MIIKYSLEKLNNIIKSIFELTGVSLSIVDTNRNVLVKCQRQQDYCTLFQSTPDGKEKCKECDIAIMDKCRESKKLERHICKSGLYDSILPIIKDDTVVAFSFVGRVRSENSPEIPEFLPNIDKEMAEQLKKLYKELPFIAEKQLSSLYELLPLILFDNAIHIVRDAFVNDVVDFIDEKLHESLSIEKLCLEFHVSKNYLYKSFHENLGTTVNDYIIERRLNHAKNLLISSNDPVYKIAHDVGIDNYTYFCKLFKQKNGQTPTQYRKNKSIP